MMIVKRLEKGEAPPPNEDRKKKDVADEIEDADFEVVD